MVNPVDFELIIDRILILKNLRISFAFIELSRLNIGQNLIKPLWPSPQDALLSLLMICEVFPAIILSLLRFNAILWRTAMGPSPSFSCSLSHEERRFPIARL